MRNGDERNLRERDGRAFTLIEVLLVATIAGIAAVIVAPFMLETGSMRSQAAARAVIADILFAQNEAIARQTERRLVFVVTDNKYTLTDATGTALEATWKSGGTHEMRFGSDQRFQGVTLTSADFDGGATLSFDAMGSPASGGTVELTAGATVYRIRIAAFTGRVTIEPVATGG